jgi:hypothetical protein
VRLGVGFYLFEEPVILDAPAAEKMKRRAIPHQERHGKAAR